MIRKLVKYSLTSILGLIPLVTALAPANALPNLPYLQDDQFSATSDVNIRLTPCSTTIVGGARKGLTAYYYGEVSATKTCFGKTSKWRKVAFVGPNPDGGNESVSGWVADYLLDNVPEVYKTNNIDNESNYVRVILNSGTLSLRKNSLTGVILKKLPNKSAVVVTGYLPPVVIGGVKRFPTMVIYTAPDGKKTTGYVDANYLVAYSVYD